MIRPIMVSVLTATFCGSLLAATVEEYVAACTQNSNMDKALCECVAHDASNQLSDQGFEFFVATARKDRGTTGRLMQQLDQSEIMTATMLAMKGPMDCANRGVAR